MIGWKTHHLRQETPICIEHGVLQAKPADSQSLLVTASNESKFVARPPPQPDEEQAGKLDFCAGNSAWNCKKRMKDSKYFRDHQLYIYIASGLLLAISVARSTTSTNPLHVWMFLNTLFCKLASLCGSLPERNTLHPAFEWRHVWEHYQLPPRTGGDRYWCLVSLTSLVGNHQTCC